MFSFHEFITCMQTYLNGDVLRDNSFWNPRIGRVLHWRGTEMEKKTCYRSCPNFTFIWQIWKSWFFLHMMHSRRLSVYYQYIQYIIQSYKKFDFGIIWPQETQRCKTWFMTYDAHMMNILQNPSRSKFTWNCPISLQFFKKIALVKWQYHFYCLFS